MRNPGIPRPRQYRKASFRLELEDAHAGWVSPASEWESPALTRRPGSSLPPGHSGRGAHCSRRASRPPPSTASSTAWQRLRPDCIINANTAASAALRAYFRATLTTLTRESSITTGVENQPVRDSFQMPQRAERLPDGFIKVLRTKTTGERKFGLEPSSHAASTYRSKLSTSGERFPPRLYANLGFQQRGERSERSDGSCAPRHVILQPGTPLHPPVGLQKPESGQSHICWNQGPGPTDHKKLSDEVPGLYTIAQIKLSSGQFGLCEHYFSFHNLL